MNTIAYHDDLQVCVGRYSIHRACASRPEGVSVIVDRLDSGEILEGQKPYADAKK